MDGNYSDARVPCKVCGRTFAPEVLAKHANICKKTNAAASKRKPFDSSKQRVLDGELSLKQIKAAQKKDIKPPKSHWREKHQDFINAVRNARGVQAAIDSGGPLPPPPPPSINPDYVQCPYCSRRFSQQAAERHINFCKEQQSRLPRGKPAAAATAKQNARLNYQVPKPKAKTPAAPAASVPAARPGARPAPTSTRTPVGGVGGTGGAARGRAAPAREGYGQGAGTRPAITDHRGKPGHPSHAYMDDDLTDYPAYNKQHQQHHESPSVYRQQRHQNHDRHVQNQPVPGLGNDFMSSPDDFYTPFVSTEQQNSNHSPMNARERSRKADGMPVKSNPTSAKQCHYLNKMKGTFEDDDMFESASPVFSPKNAVSKGQFCYECGSKYPVPTAKFCCECGVKRIDIPTSDSRRYAKGY